MFINGQLYTILSIALPIAIWIGLTVAIKKIFKNYYGVIVGVIISGMLFGFFQEGVPKVYIVNNNMHVKAFRLIGTIKYTFDNGNTIQLQPNPKDLVVINNSSHMLVIEEITYQNSNFIKNRKKFEELLAKTDSTYEAKNEPKLFSIGTYTTGNFRLAHKWIDYFFDESVPQKIKEYGSSNKKKYWLRKVD